MNSTVDSWMIFIRAAFLGSRASLINPEISTFKISEKLP